MDPPTPPPHPPMINLLQLTRCDLTHMRLLVLNRQQTKADGRTMVEVLFDKHLINSVNTLFKYSFNSVLYNVLLLN